MIDIEISKEQIIADYNRSLSMPHSKEKSELLRELVAKADIIKDHYMRKYLRWMYASELMRCGDQGKVFPIVAEYIALRDEEEEWVPPGGVDGIEYMSDYCLEVLRYLPQISLSQAEAVIKKIEEMILYNRLGRRLYFQRMFRFYDTIDTYKALDYFKQFKSVRRDMFSDCRACEQQDMVRLFFRIGDMSRADELAKPILDGTLECHDVPRGVWQIYLQRALDYKDLKKAVPIAENLYRKSVIGDPTDLGYFGAVMRCFAFSAPERAEMLLKKYIINWEPLWDREKWFSFVIGAWTVCHELAKLKDIMVIELQVKSVPFWRKDGIYNLEELGDWFYNEALNTAECFDRRNGTNYYVQELERAACSMEYKEGQRFFLIKII